MKQSKDKKPLRYQMAQKALEIGVKPTARMFHSSPSVVRVWRDRFKTEGYSGLADRSRKPHHSPRETPQYIKEHIIALKSKYKRLGAEQVRILESLPQAPKTMRKIWRDAGIPSRKRPKKHVTKNNLRAIKKLFQLFEQSMEDTKDLMDIPEYYLQAKMLNLPKVQYTFREVSCGILFLGFANNISLTHAQLFAVYINHFLKKFKALPEKSMRQTDNGSEYIGSWNAKNPSAYTRSIESLPGQWHNTIFPGAHRMQSDVETIHNLMETEFYEIELFENRKDFLNKATTYQLFFNLHRPNSYKEHKTPLQLVQEKKPDLDQRLLMIPPVDLDKLLNWKISLIQGGKDLLTVPLLFVENIYFFFNFRP
ncbi:MAG: helix-turn-helix domain containing protein [Candidatus Omnitrophica bacterium]|nr:helix-turn-helix domain containing protein [Candidatus Omnitrophota bacterium]